MAIPVDGARDAAALDRVAQDREIARRILLVAERRRRHLPRRVVDRSDEGHRGPPPFEPVVAAAVELEEEALGRHPRAAAPVAGGAAPSRAREPRRPEELAEALPADEDRLTLGEELGEVTVVDLAVRPPSELDDPGPHPGPEAPRRRPAPVAVDEAGRTVALIGGPDAPQLALREPDQLGCLDHRQLALHDPGQHPRPSLFLRGHRDRRLLLRRLTESRCSQP